MPRRGDGFQHVFMDVPEPDDKVFVRRTLRLIQETDTAARETVGAPATRLAQRGVKHVYRRPEKKGTCVGCGCPLGEIDPDCSNCRARDYMRTYVKVQRICKMIEAAFP